MLYPAGYVLVVPVGYGPRAFPFPGAPMRVTAFIDGFNLHHALDVTGQHHLTWLDLRRLCLEFAPPPEQLLTEVYYFSA